MLGFGGMGPDLESEEWTLLSGPLTDNGCTCEGSCYDSDRSVWKL